MDDTRRELDSLQIRTAADLTRMWELLMEPLGFRSRSLWVSIIGADRRPTRFLIEVGAVPEHPDGRAVEGLYSVLEQVLREEGGDCSAAFLVARPGRGAPQERDLALARLLVEGARRTGVPVEPLCAASDVAVTALPVGDVAA